MTRNQLIFILGFLLMAIPFSGFPHDWKNVAYIAMGFILLLLAIVSYVRRVHMFSSSNNTSSDTYEENSR